MKAKTSLVNGRWLLGVCILAMPVLLVLFLGSQAATSQVRHTFAGYYGIPEITRWQDVTAVPQNTVVMLRGRLLDPACRETVCSDLLVYQERPAPDRAVRFQETFGQSFPAFILALDGGNVVVAPEPVQQRIIQHTQHTQTSGDRQHVGFRHGDVVTVQGQVTHAPDPVLREITGISGHDKAQLMQEWQRAFWQMSWLRNLTGLGAGVGLLGLIVQIRRLRRASTIQEATP